MIRSDGEEREEFPRSPFEIGTKEEGELSGEVEGEEDSQLSEMDKMKEALSKMEVKQNESRQMMGGMINLLQQMQMQLGTLSASMATLSSRVQQSPSTPPPHIPFPTTHSPYILSSSSQHATVHNPFRVESKVDIKVFDGRMDVESLETWIQALEVYFSCHNYTDE